MRTFEARRRCGRLGLLLRPDTKKANSRCSLSSSCPESGGESSLNELGGGADKSETSCQQCGGIEVGSKRIGSAGQAQMVPAYKFPQHINNPLRNTRKQQSGCNQPGDTNRCSHSERTITQTR